MYITYNISFYHFQVYHSVALSSLHCWATIPITRTSPELKLCTVKQYLLIHFSSGPWQTPFWFLENYPLDIIKSNVGGSTVRMDLSLTLRCQVPGVLEAIWNLRYSPESAVLCILLCCVVQTPDPLGRSRTVLTIPGFSRLRTCQSGSQLLLSELP